MSAKVLIVEQEPAAQMLSDILALENYRTRKASSGKEALDILNKEFFDVVLMEYHGMKDVDGMEIIRHISEVFPRTKIIVLTANPKINIAVQSLRLHIHDFLIKPVHPSQIINSIKSSITSQDIQNYSEKLKGIKVFISYGREDEKFAKKMFDSMKKIGLVPWLDTESLIPGSKWKNAISQAIRESRFFIALFSSKSVNKKGFLQKELKEALEVLDEYPESMIYLIPAKVDECELSHHRVIELQWVDLFTDWDDGFKKIVTAMAITLG